jgi:hypothetical protein
MIHRVNSEGLRRRAIALSGGTPRTVYIVFGLGYCQRLRRGKSLLWIVNKAATFCRVAGTGDFINGPVQQRFLASSARDAPYCGHIHRTFIAQSVGI